MFPFEQSAEINRMSVTVKKLHETKLILCSFGLIFITILSLIFILLANTAHFIPLIDLFLPKVSQ